MTTEDDLRAEWKTHGERVIYTNRWVSLWLVDVEQPDGHRFEHHVVRLRSLAATVVVNHQQQVLMIWRHRFITKTWSWELPMGLVEDGETPDETAIRETVEETGWRPSGLKSIVYAQAANGITDSEHFIFRADEATEVGPPSDMKKLRALRG